MFIGEIIGVEQVLTSSSASHSALDKSLLKGIAWTGVVKGTSQLLSWASTLIVARILAPSDYGLIAMATSVLGLITLVNEFGLGSAIVTLPNLSERQLGQLNSVAVLLGCIGFVIASLLALPMGLFFGSPELPAVFIVMATGFIIGSFRSVPLARLEKGLRFKVLALIDGGQAILLASSLVTMAWLGFGYWTLALASLLATTAGTIMAVVVSPQRFVWPHIESLREVLRFSWHLLGTRLCWYLASTSDLFVGGRVLGQMAIGAYTFGATLANIPIEKVTGTVNRVTPAFYSAVQTDFTVLKRYLLGLTEGLALVTFPLAVGMSLVADDFVRLALGDKWETAIGPLQVLSLVAAWRSVSSLVPPVLFVIGASRLAMWNGIVAALVFPVGFYVGTFWGMIGLAFSWMIMHPFNLIPMYWRVFRVIELPIGHYVKALWPALSGTVVMAITVVSIRWSFSQDTSRWILMVYEIVGGGTAYFLTIVALHRDRIWSFLRMMKGANE